MYKTRVTYMATTDAGSGSARRCEFMCGSSPTVTNSDNNLSRDIRALGMDGQKCRRSFRKWRYGGRDHVWNLSCFALLFFSSLDFTPVKTGSAWVCTTFRVSQVEVDLPHAPDPPKGQPAQYWLVAGLMGPYDCVHGTVVWLLPFHSFPFLLLYGVIQRRRCAPNEVDNVTARMQVKCPELGYLG